jgi:hypothetical protein
MKQKIGTAWMLLTVCTVAMIGSLALFSDPAEALRGKGYYSRQYQFDRPVRGYEGWVFPGYYCTYKRYPRRICRYDKRGRERCRITGWTLKQICY